MAGEQRGSTSRFDESLLGDCFRRYGDPSGYLTYRHGAGHEAVRASLGLAGSIGRRRISG
jgi:hypothetical protein